MFVLLDYRYRSLSVAIGRPVTMSSVSDEHVAEYSLDGMMRLTDSTLCAMSKSRNDNWWQVQLARDYNIRQVIIYHTGL